MNIITSFFKFNRATISGRLLLYFVLIIIFVLIATGTILNSYFLNLFIDDALYENQKSLEQVYNQTDYFILKSMNELALSLTRPNPNETNVPAFFSESSKDYPEVIRNIPYELNDFVFQNRSFVNSIYLYSKDKALTISHKVSKYISVEEAAKLEEFSWISQISLSNENVLWLKPRNTIIYDNNIADRANIITLVSTYPLAAPPKEAKGYIAVNIKEDVIHDYIVKNTPVNSGKLLIIDDKGSIISHYDRGNLFDDISREHFVKEVIKSNEPRSFKTTFKSTEYAITFKHSEYNNWYYVAMLPTGPLYQKAGLIRTKILITSFIIFIIALILSMLFSNKIPLTKMLKNNEYDFLCSYYLNRLLTAKPDDNISIESDLATFGIEFKEKHFAVVEFLISNSNSSNHLKQTDTQLIKNKIIKYIRNINIVSKTAVKARYYPLSANNTAISVIINSSNTNITHIQEFINNLQFYCYSTFGFYLTAGVGRFGEQIFFLSQSYIDAKIAIQYKFLNPENISFYYNEISSRASDINVLQSDYPERLKKLLKTNNVNEIRSLLSHFRMTVSNNNNLNYQYVKKEIAKFRKILFEYLEEIDISFDNICGHDSIKSNFIRPCSIHVFFDTYITAIENLFTYIEEKKARKNSELVKAVEKFIANNINGDLSLSLIADILHITPQYLSKIFKEQIGANFIDYVTLCKLEESKKLLSTTSMNMDEIANCVGYNHGTNFSRKFKELTGLTPSEYRLREIKKHLKVSC